MPQQVVTCSMSSTASRITMPVSTERSVTAPRRSAILAPTPCAAMPPCRPYASVVGPSDASRSWTRPALRFSVSAISVPSSAATSRPQRLTSWRQEA